MTNFTAILKDESRLAKALAEIGLTERQKETLVSLAGYPNGIEARRDEGNRVRGEGIYACSMIGSALTKHLGCDGPIDKMMWIGTLHQDDAGGERWVIRPEVRSALKSLNWIS